METNKHDTVLVEITSAWTKASGRVVEPGPLSIVRVTNQHADKLEEMGVGKKLNLAGSCLHSEILRREKLIRKGLPCS